MTISSVLSIAGSDSGAGAGIQADLRAAADHQVWCATAITAITVQDTVGVQGVMPVPPGVVVKQARAVLADGRVGAIKIGMLGSAAHVEAVAELLSSELAAGVPVVLDPVMVSTSGRRLLDEDALSALTSHLVPRCALITPNVDEAKVLAGGEELRTWAAKQAPAVLLTGGDQLGDHVVDELVSDVAMRVWRAPRIAGGPFHGTGCMLSSAIAARLCLGQHLVEAIDGAIAYVRRRLADAIRPGRGAAVGGWDS